MRAQSLAGEDGATAVEYGLIVAAIAALIVLIVIVMGRQTEEMFCGTASAMNNVVTTQAAC